MLRIYYRATASDKTEDRPKYFSKLAALKNFIFCLSRITEYEFTLVHDGDLQPEIQNLVSTIGVILKLRDVGNSGSFWRAFSLAIEHDASDLIYFVEDDYLHTSDALKKLLECNEDLLDVDYMTLYDHPVRYAIEYSLGLDLPLRKPSVYVSRSHHWRTVESTCMTFAASVKTLKEDLHIFEKYVRTSTVPQDRALFRCLQGLLGYEQDSTNRTLIGPIPSLATHCREPWLAPIVDWERIVLETSAW